MKTRLFLLIFIINIFSGCDPAKKKTTYARIVRDVPVVKKVLYPDGKIKLIITYHKGTLSNIEYFDHLGRWDSIVDYKRAIRSQVMQFKYYTDGAFDRVIQRQGKFFLIQKYNSKHNLIYEEPVDINKLSKTNIEIKSRMNYLSRKTNDTFFINNSSLPAYNRGYKFIGFNPRAISIDSGLFMVTSNSILPSRHNVCIMIYLHEQNEHKQLLDSIVIPVK